MRSRTSRCCEHWTLLREAPWSAARSAALDSSKVTKGGASRRRRRFTPHSNALRALRKAQLECQLRARYRSGSLPGVPASSAQRRDRFGQRTRDALDLIHSQLRKHGKGQDPVRYVLRDRESPLRESQIPIRLLKVDRDRIMNS